MRFLFLVGVVALCATSFINAKSLDEKNANALRVLRRSMNKFSLNFLKTVATGEERNLICSPMSVFTVLSELYFGARGDTRDQLRKGLSLPNEDNLIRTGFSQLLKSFDLYKNTRVELHLANRIFIDGSVKPQKSFTSVIAQDFRSKVQSVNFKKKKEVSHIVNKWCKDNTNGRIKDILKAGNVNPMTSLLLVTAVYFKGSWNSKFNVDKTEDRLFHINAEDKMKIPTMYQYGLFDYGELPEVDATYLKLKYEMKKDSDDDDAISMIIVRPNTVNGLAKVIKGLDTVSFENLSYDERNCHVFLPKFKIESKIQLKDTLQEMDMTDMFMDGLSDFTGIHRASSLTVSKIMQKAFIDVNEEGSEAAAVASVSIGNRFAETGDEQPDVTFNVDRPFLALIVAGSDKPTIVFANTWYGPERC